MQIHTLQKITARKSKIVGRGQGSGVGGHTTGRGTKGQKARERVVIWFDGSKSGKSLIGRLPFLRGKGKFKPWGKSFVAISLDRLKDWPEKTVVSDENLIKAGMIRTGNKAKLVGEWKGKQALKIKVAASTKAMETIKAAGGSVAE